MFSLCEGMKWAHLPVGGGLYDQDPDLLDGFRIIFSERSIHEAEEERRRDRESGRKNPKTRVKGASRSR